MHRIDTSTKSVDKFGAGKHGFKDGNKASGIAPTQFNAAWADSVQEEVANVVELEGGTLDRNDNTQLWQHIARWHGQCRLALAGGLLTLSPFNGNKIIVGGVARTIPSAGITLPATGATDGLLTYIYAYMNAGVMTLESSATGHSTDTTTGVEIKTGDTTRTLVGMARTVAGAWVDAPNQRFVRSWFNRESLKVGQVFQSTRSTGSSTPTETSASDRCEFLSWTGERLMGVCSSEVYILTSSASISADTALWIDGAMAITSASINPDTANQLLAFTAQVRPVPFLAEGYHYGSPYISWGGGNGISLSHA